MTLRTKILTAFLVISLPLVVINVWWIAGQLGRERQRVLDRLRQDAEEASDMLQVFLADLADRGQQTALHAPSGDRLQAYLRDRLAYLRFWNTGITGLAWTDAQGEVQVGEPGDLFQKGVRFAGRETLQALRNGKGWALDELVIEEAGDRAQGILRMVTLEIQGTFRGVVGIRMRPEVFQPLFPSGRLWSQIRLADQTGRLAYATDWVDPTLDDRFAWAEAPGLREALKSGQASVHAGPVPGGRGRTELMVAHVPVAGTGWVASAVIPEAEAMRESRRALYGQVAIQILLVALCAVAALALANRVTLPARRLADVARRIAGGDRSARAGIQGQDELATLGHAFDEMAAALESSWQAVSAERDAAEDTAARLATLSRLASLANSTLDPSKVFDFIAEAASHLLDGAVALLLVSEAEDGPVSLRASYAVTRLDLQEQNRFGAGEGLTGWVFQHRKPLVLPDMLADSRTANRAWVEGEGLRAFAGVPLMLRDRCLGVLCASQRGERPFAGRDVDLLTSLAAHAAAAIQNARMYEQAAHEAALKGLLLDELNHRVRNNLALIVSFMELQRATPAGRLAAAVLDDAIGRVKGLALIHNVLGGASFQAGQYGVLVHRLAAQTLLQGPLAGRLTLRVEEEPLHLPSKALTALGIITNELFTNIAKHAFPNGRSGVVEVSVAPAGPEVVIRVCDNGVKFPPELMDGPDQLGLRLIRSLVEVSLQGSFSLETDEGTTAVIRFPRPAEGAPDTSPPFGDLWGNNGKGRAALEQRKEV